MTKTKIAPTPRTEAIPMTTMVEVPVLGEEERAEVIASLREAEDDIRKGRAKTFTADEFEHWLVKRADDIRTLILEQRPRSGSVRHLVRVGF